MGITAGEIVKSRAGRDAGRYFVVKIIDDSYVLIVTVESWKSPRKEG